MSGSFPLSKRKDRLGQIQELSVLLSKQLLAYQKGDFEKAMALYPNMEACLRRQERLNPPASEERKKVYLRTREECRSLQKEIHALLQEQKEQIKKEHLACQLELALLKLDKET